MLINAMIKMLKKQGVGPSGDRRLLCRIAMVLGRTAVTGRRRSVNEAYRSLSSINREENSFEDGFLTALEEVGVGASDLLQKYAESNQRIRDANPITKAILLRILEHGQVTGLELEWELTDQLEVDYGVVSSQAFYLVDVGCLRYHRVSRVFGLTKHFGLRFAQEIAVQGQMYQEDVTVLPLSAGKNLRGHV